MSNLDPHPTETQCSSARRAAPAVELFEAREVPLGGLRAMTVRRTLPQRTLPTVGAWCFLDRFGPDTMAMRVLPHPHSGLQTLTWPLTGSVHHRDSLGSDVVVRAGELNLMAAGRGISHSEVSPAGTQLAGLQLWIALPQPVLDAAPAFEQHRDLPVVTGDNYRATVMVGELSDVLSPAGIHSPLVGADFTTRDGGLVTWEVLPAHEHAVLVLKGSVSIDGVTIDPGPLAYLGVGRRHLSLEAEPGTRWILLGGEPFAEELLMWWNFVGRSHEEIVQARLDWEAGHPRFGSVAGHGTERIPAPPLPRVRLSPRRRR